MERLKELREEKELTQLQLGELLGFNSRTIGQYERGQREPDFQTLKKLCDFFEVTAGYILGFEEI